MEKNSKTDPIYEPDLDSPRGKGKFYNLMMFPYLSAEGLHVGNMYAFVGADIYGRKKRMEGYDVFEPVGLDGFGIHSENYALKVGKHPKTVAETTQKNFYKQLQSIGNGFAWDERLETHDPDYYRWTQWIFVQMFKKGLAYRKKAKVNWCPKCLTVLADEQVLAGECERCGASVIKKELEQWFFKITDYAERLLNDLEKIDWSEKVKIAQKNWIGKSDGLIFVSPVKDTDMIVETFSAHFEAFTADTFVVIAPDHPLLSKLLEGIPNKNEILAFCEQVIARRRSNKEEQEPEGIFTGRYTVDPVGNGELPIWVASYALADYGTGIVKCSAHDGRDFAFAKKYDIPLKVTLLPLEPEKQNAVSNFEICYSDMRNGVLVEPALFAGKRAGDVRDQIVRYCVEKKLAKPVTTYHLRDWLISRQRYWGPPIPMIYCPACAKASAGKENAGWQAVPEEDLPVLLPDVKNFHPTGTDKSPLATVEEFVNVRCPKCGGEARRETDVSDTFLDSAWYFFRYIDSKNTKEFASEARVKKWLPVDMYIGGAEHSVLHLMYARFITKVFCDWGLIDFDEPFKKFRAHGLLIKDGAKMSKSKGNVVNPDDYIKNFGADVFRMYLMFLGPFEQGGDFRDSAIAGIVRFLERVKNLAVKERDTLTPDAESILHRSIRKISEDIERLHYNTAISQLMILLSALERGCDEASFKNFLKLLAPFAPFIAEELWDELGEAESIHHAAWPTYDESKTQSATTTIVVQINGKVRERLEIETGASDEELKTKALELPKIQELVGGKTPSAVIVVPGRLVNIVF